MVFDTYQRMRAKGASWAGTSIILISRLVPIILISSSSTGNSLPCSLIFLEEYGALLNEISCYYCCWTSLKSVFLIIDNERKIELVHSHKYFTGELGKDV